MRKIRFYKPFYLFVFCQAFAFLSLAQTRLGDKLKQEIYKAGTDNEKTADIFAFCELGYTLHPDTLMYYSEMARRIALENKDLKSEVRALYYACGALTTKGLLDSSLDIANRCLEILSVKVNDPILEANLYNQKGRCYVRKNQYKEAIDMGYKTISGGERNNDIMLQVKGKTMIGWAYLEMGQFKEALSWHMKALTTPQDSTILEKYAILFANLATNYNSLGNLDSAFYFIEKGIRFARKNENLFALSNSLAIESELFVKSGHPKLSEPVLKEVVEIRKQIGDPFYIASDLSQLGYYYAHYGQPEKGIAACNEGIAIARQYKLYTKLFFLYGSLADNYKATGNSVKYAEVLENIISLKDSVYQLNSATALAEMQAKYDAQKSENIIAQQKLSLVNKNYWLFGSMGVLLVGIVLTSLLFSYYRRKQKLKDLLLLEEEKFQMAQAVAKAEENERKRIAADLHDNLGAYAAAIASNVDHLGPQITDKASLNELRINAQSIVSQLNDTIWVLKKDNLSFTSISDRIKIYIQRVQAGSPGIKIDVVENINKDILFPPANAFHLFRITQEAVTNAIKHSGGKQVVIFLESGKDWKISIEDDGSGMLKTFNSQLGGNGLINMKKRAEMGGFTIGWEANSPRGTRVVISHTSN